MVLQGNKLELFTHMWHIEDNMRNLIKELYLTKNKIRSVEAIERINNVIDYLNSMRIQSRKVSSLIAIKGNLNYHES